MLESLCLFTVVAAIRTICGSEKQIVGVGSSLSGLLGPIVISHMDISFTFESLSLAFALLPVPKMLMMISRHGG